MANNKDYQKRSWFSKAVLIGAGITSFIFSAISCHGYKYETNTTEKANTYHSKNIEDFDTKQSTRIEDLTLYPIKEELKPSNLNPDPKIIEDYVLKNQQDPLEMLVELTKTHQSLTVGEAHDNLNAKRFIADSLSELKKSGIEFLAVELDSANQKYIDRYVKGEISQEELKNRIGYIDNSCSIYMIDKAKEAGIKVIAIDKTGGTRDEHMFEVIKDKIINKNPNAKFLVYIGAQHIYESPKGTGESKGTGAYLEEFHKNASIKIVNPEEVSGIVKIENIPNKIGFLTDNKPIANMRYEKDNSDSPTLNVYYGKDLDAMITIDKY